MRNPSKITMDLAVDDALVQDADFEFDSDDRQYLDNQIRGGHQHLVNCLIRGVFATYVRLDGASAAVVKGDVVCPASSSSATEPTVTKAIAAVLTNAMSGAGIVLASAAAGAYVLVAFGGMLPPSTTGLSASAPGPVRINTTTARLQRVPSLGSGDYAMGAVDNAGWLVIQPGAGGAAGGGAVAGTFSRYTPAHTLLEGTDEDGASVDLLDASGNPLTLADDGTYVIRIQCTAVAQGSTPKAVHFFEYFLAVNVTGGEATINQDGDGIVAGTKLKTSLNDVSFVFDTDGLTVIVNFTGSTGTYLASAVADVQRIDDAA